MTREKGDLKRDDPLRSMSSSASAVSRFIRRADEISKHEPTTSYYCKLRAIEVAMESTPRPDDLIRKLLEQLEVRAICLFFFSFAFAWLLSLSLSLSLARSYFSMTSMTTVSTMRKDLRSLGGGKEEHLNSLLFSSYFCSPFNASLSLSLSLCS